MLDDGSPRRDLGGRASSRRAGARRRAAAAGWLGKPHACAQLAAAASGDVLVFVDADVRLRPGAVRAAVHLLEASGLDLVAPHPRQETGTLSERLVQPLLQWSFLTTLPLRVAERSARPSLSAANGQFLVVRRAAYERAGGHVPGCRARRSRPAARDQAQRRPRRRRRRHVAGHVPHVHGVGAAARRLRQVVVGGVRRPGRQSAAVLGALGLAYVVPAVAALRGSRVGMVGYLAGVLGRMVSAQRTGGRVLDSFAHPVSIALFGYLTARSHVQHKRGRLAWKDRAL